MSILRAHFLLTKEQAAFPPKGLFVRINYGFRMLFNQKTNVFDSGDHCLVEGTPDAFKDFLAAFPGVWVGRTRFDDKRAHTVFEYIDKKDVA